MKTFKKYVSPKTLKKLDFRSFKIKNDVIEKGEFFSEDGEKYPIIDGLPYLTFPFELAKEEVEIINWYDNNYENYDEYLPLTFKTFNEN